MLTAMPDGKSSPAVHHAAQQGFSSCAATYSRGRPDYPPELVTWLRQTLELAPGKKALDLGAGTGKFTRLLLHTGADIVAVEPIDAMCAQLLQDVPGVAALAASAQSMPLAKESLDVVVCAQAFHWFASLDPLREIGRVLKAGGKLGLVWNVRDESVDWVAAITRITAPYQGDTPRFHSGEWRQLFPSPQFTELEETAVRYRQLGSAQQVIVDRTMSVSFIAALPDAERAQVTARLNELIASRPELNGRGSIGFPYLTRAYRSTRRG
jgi:ubiquinone/menaquinone biosynthesis C-methylase UbiE